ncbi:hypothetical protein [Bacillus cereus group sp. TH150LC]|uniref:hypothetical protein n=1 Tax=Bacillus cereus group sp. TH150LC TaxID=3018061 RepID=UPI0022E76B9E|nr:hypothetical protein [Bacillus cereus group sp. TH150LC]MDA1658342.1 hypothetical protein [Bacillus cereus group sp. TH150LC]
MTIEELERLKDEYEQFAEEFKWEGDFNLAFKFKDEAKYLGEVIAKLRQSSR